MLYYSTFENGVGMTEKSLLGLPSDERPETDLDLFVDDPLGFDEAYGRVHRQLIDGPNSETTVTVPFCSYEDLLRLKIIAGRPRDMDDIRRLRISRGEE